MSQSRKNRFRSPKKWALIPYRKYGPVEWEIGARGKPYAKWAAEMAVGLETGVPWNVYTKIWWSNSSFPWRPAEDVAFAVSRFIQNNGSFFNDYMKMQYDLPPWSISILPDCRTAVYNTARISSQSSQMKMIPVGGGLSWESHTEEAPSADADDSDTLSSSGLWEQINVTSSDYLWYMTNPILNVGLHFETWNAGVLGRITLSGLNEGTRDLTKQRWANKVGLKGETLSLCTLNGSSSVKWVKDLLLAQKQPVTWYKATFDAPEGNGPLTLDMGSMGKGQIWINGEGIGHQWPGYIARGICGECSYAGIYSEKKCQANCEQPSQRWQGPKRFPQVQYHVPRSWLKPSGNLLVVFEEWGGDPAGVSMARRATARVCADILKTYSSQGMDYHKELVETIMKVLAMSISYILHWVRTALDSNLVQ
ncbi:Beta-galactosidase 2 [Capsicum chinense]|nr:Beta-galactosidase 2 [Capsicum chinense]